MIHALTIAVTSLALAADPAPVNWPPMPKEGKHVDYIKWYDNVRRAGLKPEDDAYPIYKEIFPTLDSTDPNAKRPDEFRFEGHRSDDKTNTELGPWDPKDHPEWEAAYQRTKDAVRGFERAASKPYYFVPDNFGSSLKRTGPPLFFIFEPTLTEFRIYTKGLSDISWRAPSGRVDSKAFMNFVRTRLDCSRQVERVPLMINKLVGMATRAMTYEDIQYAVKNSVFDLAELQQLQSDLRRRDTPLPLTASGFPAECAVVFDILQYAITDSPDTTDPMIAAVVTSLGKSGLTLEEVARDAREYYDQLCRLYAEPGLPNDADRASIEKETRHTHEHHPVLKSIVPEFSRAHSLHLRVESSRAATRLILAMHIYKLEHKKWPPTLDDLPAEILKEFRLDPLSNQPFVYRLVDGEPLLYSLSLNCKDDGGVHDPKYETNPNSDFVYWPPQRSTMLPQTTTTNPTKKKNATPRQD